MSLPELGADIDRMTAYCTYCPKMCRFSCPAAAAESRETATPWGMMRLLELAKDASVAIDDEVADAFYHCTGCRRCQTYCEHDNDVPRALWKARRWAVDSGFLPEPYLDLQESFEESGTPYGAPEPGSIDESVFDDAAPVAFWPDCSTVGHQPELVADVGRLLEKLLGDKVRLIKSDDFDHPPCCGFPLTGAGIEDPDGCRDKLWPSFDGVDELWTDCPGLAAWNSPDASWNVSEREDDPQMGHIFELLAAGVDETPPEQPLELESRLLHESCYVTRQLKASEDVKKIIDAIAETPPGEMAYSGDASPCCGGRCHYRVLEPEASDRAAEKVLEALDRHDDTDKLMTTSSMCHQAMGQAGDTGAVTSLLAMVCEAYGCRETDRL